MRNQKLNAALVIVSLITSTPLYAGSSNANFSCQSASGRTQLTASVPGDHAEHSVKFSIDGESINWKNELLQTPPYDSDKNSNIFVLGGMKSQNYHFVIVAPNADKTDVVEVFRFSAIPESIQVKKTTNGERGKLSAIVIGKDPRTEKDGQTSPKIVLDCSYAYEI